MAIHDELVDAMIIGFVDLICESTPHGRSWVTDGVRSRHEPMHRSYIADAEV